MRFAGLLFVLAMLPAGAAFAQPNPNASVCTDDRYCFPFEISAGAGYSFPEGFGGPDVDETSINSSYSAGIRRWGWTLSAAYLEAKNDQEGHQISLDYRKQAGCPLLPDTTLGCSLGIQWRNVEDFTTVRYSFGARGPVFEQNDHFRPAWTFGGQAMTGDRSESSVTAGVELPFTFDHRGSGTTPDPRWALTGTAGVVHGFEANSTLPTWSVRVAYNFTPDRSLSVGYESRVVLDAIDDDFNVDRAATIKLAIRL